MSVAAQIPTASQLVIEKAPTTALVFTRAWYRFFEAVSRLVANSQNAPAAIVLGASPFTYDVVANGIVIVQGGTVSLIEYGRNGAFTDVGVTAGPIPVNEGDQVRVTYTVAPTMTLVSQ